MRPLHRLPTFLSQVPVLAGLLVAVAPTSVAAQQLGTNGYNPYYYNQNYTKGLYLPQVPVQNGQDEVRGADGTTCRSSMGSNSAYLDVGAIGAQGYGGDVDSGTFYGRLIVPLGEQPRRIDCTKLYDLEIRRLKHELEMARAGLGSMSQTSMMGDGIPAPMKTAATTSQLVPTSAPPVATVPVAKPKGSAAKKQGWAEEGWSTSGWQQPARLGAGDVAVVAAKAKPRRRVTGGAPREVVDIASSPAAPTRELRSQDQAIGWMPVVTVAAQKTR